MSDLVYEATPVPAGRSPTTLALIKRGPDAGLVGVVIATEHTTGPQPERLRVQITPTDAVWVRARYRARTARLC
jgi:hypothetical protein